MHRSLITLAIASCFALPAGATGYKGGSAGKYARPAMAARQNGAFVRARTIGKSRDGRYFQVVATDKQGQIWAIEVRAKDARPGSISLNPRFLAERSAKYFATDTKLEPHVPWSFIRAHAGDVSGRALPKLSRSHRSIRIALPGTEKGVKPSNVLVKSASVFYGAAPDPLRNVRFDPADGIPSQRGR